MQTPASNEPTGAASDPNYLQVGQVLQSQQVHLAQPQTPLLQQSQQALLAEPEANA